MVAMVEAGVVDVGGRGSGSPSRRASSVASRAATSCLAYSLRASMLVLFSGSGGLTDDTRGVFLLRVTLTFQGELDSMFDTCALGAADMCLR